MTALFSLLLEKGIDINAVCISGGWCEADSMNDIKIYESRLKYCEDSKDKWLHDWRG